MNTLHESFPQHLLTPDKYSISRTKPTKSLTTENTRLLLDNAPEFYEYNMEGYIILGKTEKYQQYIAKKDDDMFLINISKNKNTTKEINLNNYNQHKSIVKKEINVISKKLKDFQYDNSLFIPMKSNTPIDYCFSQDGGILPCTNYILIGDPGIGKSSVAIEFVAKIQEQNPDKKILFISGEMTEMDMIPYTQRFPLWLNIETVFVSDLEEGYYKESIESKLSEGYDLVLGDSFAEIADAVRGDFNEFAKGSDKKTYNDIEKWLVDLMVVHNKGNNEVKKHTSFIFIQQMTKGGDFVGSNKLKHNTTGMLELRYTKSGQRKIVVTKNRRGFDYNNLYYSFSTNTSNPIVYDVDRIKRDKKVQDDIQKAAQEQLDQELHTEIWFESLTKETNQKEDSNESVSDFVLEV